MAFELLLFAVTYDDGPTFIARRLGIPYCLHVFFCISTSFVFERICPVWCLPHRNHSVNLNQCEEVNSLTNEDYFTDGLLEFEFLG